MFPVQISGEHLNWIKIHRKRLWKIINNLVCKDVAQKLYCMNDGFEKYFQEKEDRKKFDSR